MRERGLATDFCKENYRLGYFKIQQMGEED
jgi:hypothetical protein